MQCKKCNEPLKPHWKQCPACAEVLVSACPECGAAAMPDQDSCHACGTVLKVSCEGCGAALQPHWVACPECGIAVFHEALTEEEAHQDAARRRAESSFARSMEGVVMSQVLGETSAGAPLRNPAEPVPGPRPPALVEVGHVFHDVLQDGSEGPEMVELPGGRFRMGDIDGSGEPTEQPVREVEIPRPFAIGRYPVTFAEYDRFCERAGRVPPEDGGWGRGPRPVIIVSWECAHEYVQWLSAETGKHYRLPSEAEWEYAARSGTESAYPWGADIDTSCGNYLGDGSPSRTTPVGLYPANRFGLYDMHGNVWEWVEDVWHERYDGAPVDGSAWTDGGDPRVRVLRGGSWYTFAGRLRSAARNWFNATGRNVSMGFRLARDL